MKRLSKAILIVFAVLVASVIAAMLGLNLYVQAPGTQARIQEQLGKALGVPLVLANTSLTPWGQLKINGISVPTEEGNFLQATSFSARYRVFALLQKRLEIYDLRAERPEILWRQNADGKWTFPKRTKIKKPKGAKDSEEDDSDDLQVAVDGFKLVHGSINFLDRENRAVASFTGVNMDYSILTEERVEGMLTVDCVFWNKLAFEQVRTPVRYAGGELQFSAIEGVIAGGALTGTIIAELDKSEIPFTAALNVEGVDLNRLMSETGWARDQFAGRLNGSLEAHGDFRKLAKAKGPGTLVLTNGRIKQFDFFRTIGEVLHVPALADLALQDSHADFHLEGEKIHLETLVLNAPDVKITAIGPIRLTGKLALDARLGFTDRTAQQLPDFIRTNFTDTDAAGQFGLDFKITGTLEKPKTDLLDRVVGGKLSAQFDELVTTLFSGKKKKEGDKKKEEKKKKTEPSRSSPPAPTAVDPTIITVAPPTNPVSPEPARAQP